MANVQCPVESIGNPSVGDTVEMQVKSIQDGVATLTYGESDGSDMTKPEPSTIGKMAEAFKPDGGGE